MQITNINESGSNNTIMWAIASGAKIKDDVQLQSFINDELFYQVTFSDINFFQLFRLTQTYRDKVRILTERPAAVPPMRELVELFPGMMNNGKGDIKLCDIANVALEHFMNLSLQMMNDDDIISSSSIRMFIPMICRRFDVQIPVPFIDIVEAMTTDEANDIFITGYPDTLHGIVDTPDHSVQRILQLMFVRNTSILKYHKRFDQYVKAIKYSPLQNVNTDELYKFAPLGVYRYDNITRGEVRCSLFKPNPDTTSQIMDRLKRLNTPIKAQFVVQLPIQYMEILLNSYGLDMLETNCFSSMNTIIDDGLSFNDYIMPIEDEESEEVKDQTESINVYKIRIAEANNILMNSIGSILTSPSKDIVDSTMAFSLMPSIYTSKAVITINTSYASAYRSHHEPVIAKMFDDMLTKISPLLNEIN